jgi:predicted AAA+ superfamily ATPase
MLDRHIRQELLKRLDAYPAVTLVGPRQCGKTTLGRSLGGQYFDLDRESERLRADLEWDKLVTSSSLVVLDEAQSWPALFTRLRGAIDTDRKRHGRFLLLGSVSPSMMVHVSQSLAGRLSLLELTPLLSKLLKHQLNHSPVYGKLSFLTIQEIEDRLDHLIRNDELRIEFFGDLPLILLSDSAWDRVRPWSNDLECRQAAAAGERALNEMLFQWRNRPRHEQLHLLEA